MNQKSPLPTLRKHGLRNSYWGAIIYRAWKRGTFTDSNMDRSGNWLDCACGKLDPRIPRCGHGVFMVHPDQPKDGTLERLGQTFWHYVRDNNFIGAADVLGRIEKRAGEILARIPS